MMFGTSKISLNKKGPTKKKSLFFRPYESKTFQRYMILGTNRIPEERQDYTLCCLKNPKLMVTINQTLNETLNATFISLSL